MHWQLFNCCILFQLHSFIERADCFYYNVGKCHFITYNELYGLSPTWCVDLQSHFTRSSAPQHRHGATRMNIQIAESSISSFLDIPSIHQNITLKHTLHTWLIMYSGLKLQYRQKIFSVALCVGVNVLFLHMNSM